MLRITMNFERQNGFKLNNPRFKSTFAMKTKLKTDK